MSDEEKPQRPNANYNLSKPDTAVVDKDEPLHFYYNRERRLANAPQAVRDLYVVQKHNRFNLLKPLISSKPKAMLFFTIIISFVAIFVLSIMGYFDNSWSLDGNKLEIKGIKYEEMVIMLVKKSVQKNRQGYTGAVDIAVSPAASTLITAGNEDSPVFYHRIFFSAQQQEEYRFAIPFDSSELALVLQTEKSTLKIKMKPE
ncbi:MAG: hypothetical protein LBH44_06905 [Treponema sp.]|jgi:hypothetical protein|nr:hypothetical protein [Treponema sp.]